MKWLVWNEDNGQKRADAEIVDAFDAQRAAELFAHEYDRKWADYPESRDVMVAEARKGSKAVKYNVTIEQVPRYHAAEVK